MGGHSVANGVYGRQENVKKVWCEGEAPFTNFYQNVLDSVSNGFNVSQVDGSGGPFNAVGGPENICDQVATLIGGWVSLQ